jgi:hypothetical protein
MIAEYASKVNFSFELQSLEARTLGCLVSMGSDSLDDDSLGQLAV